MASNTENLNLLMKNPSTDGADTFNVQTMLNDNWQKIDNNAGTVAQTLANILKPTTPPIIGLPPSTTPDGMFQALGNTGELHVWRKTVVSSSEQPAGYTLGDVITNSEIWVENSNETVFHYATSISVSDIGLVSLVGEKTATIGHANSGENIAEFDVFKGKFVYISGGDNNKRPFIFYIPANATFYRNGTYSTNKIYADKEQRVNAHGIIPPGTTATYPVSTNPNAYQEGSDAKPAGYTLGEVKTGKHILSYQHSDLSEIHWEYSSKITVSEDGTVSLVSPSSEDIDGGDYTSVAENLIGKFARPTEDHSGFTTNVIVFFPSDATVTRDTTTYGYNAMTISKYQPVTGYAAIPAGTTIEYLGKLGDKARVQVVSYVGTGTYGSDHPNSLTFDFVPKVVMIRCDEDEKVFDAIYGMRQVVIDSYYNHYITLKWSKKTLSWYSDENANKQMNYAEYIYHAIAIG